MTAKVPLPDRASRAKDAPLQDIAKLHASLGLADPTLGGAPAAAISDVANIPSPRSWPDDQKQRFRSLPYDLQVFISAHEIRREKALRRAQNDAAVAKNKLAVLKRAPTEKTEGTETHETDAASQA